MNAPCRPLPEPDETDALAGGGGPSPERRLKMLDRLAEAGLQIALAIERRVRDAEPALPLAELNAAAQAYARVSRAVRLAVLLQEQLSQGGVDPLAAARQAEADHRQAQVDRTVRIVQRVARDHCGHGGFALGAYAGEARERLDNDDIYGLVASRPVGELVAMICEDLGLEPNWEHLAAEAWAQAEIDSGAKGSPFVDGDNPDDDKDREAPAEAALPAWKPPTFQQRAAELASDPAIMAVAARRESG